MLLALFGLGIALELLLYVPFMWRFRMIFAFAAALSTATAGGVLVGWKPNIFTVLIAIVGLYRVFNNARIVQDRMHENFMKFATLRTALTLLGLQILAVLGWFAWDMWHITGHGTWTVMVSLQLAAAAGSLLFMVRTIQRTAWPSSQKHFTDVQLPTISVAIPARNETDDLQACLTSLINSDYPKLEILVLDDCSQTKRTPEIIRSFAHAGVRFVRGEEPNPTWQPKNQAYARLEQEATGEYILFCGVDVRFAPDSLRRLASLMLARKKLMVSILPKRSPDAYGATSLIQAMRYWWELVPPRRLFNRPPVLSTCWIIKRSALKSTGGFKAVTRAILPEAYFARMTARVVDGYSFLRAGLGIGITSVKKPTEQRETAVRMRYPQLHRKPEQVVLHSFFELAFLLLPFAISVGGFWIDIGALAQIIAAITGVLLIVTHELVVLSTHVNTWWFGLIAPPFMILADIGLLHYSMWKYEFSEVDWKGRNICIPAMHVVKSLPKV